jgi:hypothetical protein
MPILLDDLLRVDVVKKSACVLYLDLPEFLLKFFGGVYSIRVFFFSFIFTTHHEFRWQSGYFHAIAEEKRSLFFRDFCWGLVDYITPVYGCRKRSNSLAERESLRVEGVLYGPIQNRKGYSENC